MLIRRGHEICFWYVDIIPFLDLDGGSRVITEIIHQIIPLKMCVHFSVCMLYLKKKVLL